MQVEDLGDLDGMVFVFDTETETAFTMRNTIVPLDIAFFDRDGRLVDRLGMVPCEVDPCPSYRAKSAFSYALEMPAGTMGEVEAGSVFSVGF